MNKVQIKILAEDFRKGIETANKYGAFMSIRPHTTLPYFPRGYCEIASELLAQYLLNFDIETELIHGKYYYNYTTERYPHTWLETRYGYIIDITLDQFRYHAGFDRFKIPTCYGSKNRTIHKLFNQSMRYETFTGIENMNPGRKQIMLTLYKLITENLQ